jgi:hypothetical protein
MARAMWEEYQQFRLEEDAAGGDGYDPAESSSDESENNQNEEEKSDGE